MATKLIVSYRIEKLAQYTALVTTDASLLLMLLNVKLAR